MWFKVETELFYLFIEVLKGDLNLSTDPPSFLKDYDGVNFVEVLIMADYKIDMFFQRGCFMTLFVSL